MKLHVQSRSALLASSLLAARNCECFAFSGVPRGRSSSLVPGGPRAPHQWTRTLHDKDGIRIESTCISGSQGGDEGDDKNSDRPFTDSDIFGQPKKKQSRKRGFDDEGEIRGPDRIKSCIPYLLVLIDGDSFGKYIYERIPPLGTLDYILLRPIVEAFQAAPILSISLFMLFALGPRFTNQSREVRFNAQQAVLIDVALIFPSLIGEAIADEHLPRALLEPATNFVWYAYVSAVVYCVLSNLRGKKPDQIPFISSAAEYAIGPF